MHHINYCLTCTNFISIWYLTRWAPFGILFIIIFSYKHMPLFFNVWPFVWIENFSWKNIPFVIKYEFHGCKRTVGGSVKPFFQYKIYLVLVGRHSDKDFQENFISYPNTIFSLLPFWCLKSFKEKRNFNDIFILGAIWKCHHQNSSKYPSYAFPSSMCCLFHLLFIKGSLGAICFFFFLEEKTSLFRHDLNSFGVRKKLRTWTFHNRIYL